MRPDLARHLLAQLRHPARLTFAVLFGDAAKAVSRFDNRTVSLFDGLMPVPKQPRPDPSMGGRLQQVTRTVGGQHPHQQTYWVAPPAPPPAPPPAGEQLSLPEPAPELSFVASRRAWRSKNDGVPIGDLTLVGRDSVPHLVLDRHARYFREDGLSFGIDDDQGWAISYTVRPLSRAERSTYDAWRAARDAHSGHATARRDAARRVLWAGPETPGPRPPDYEKVWEGGHLNFSSIWRSPDGARIWSYEHIYDFDHDPRTADVTPEIAADLATLTAPPPPDPGEAPGFALTAQDHKLLAAKQAADAEEARKYEAETRQRQAEERQAEQQRRLDAERARIARGQPTAAAVAGDPVASAADRLGVYVERLRGGGAALRGNTYAIKDQIRAAGGRWDSGRKEWVLSTDAALANALGIDGPATAAPRSAIAPAPVAPPAPSLRGEQKGRRVYVRGNTYPHKGSLYNWGFKWDPDEGAWWTGTANWEKRQARVEALKTPVDLDEPDRPANDEGFPFVAQIVFQGLPPIDVEQAQGQVRQGDGWSVKMPYHYGELRGTLGVDGDAVDVCVGPDAHAPFAYVVHQRDPAQRRYDEDKVMVGFPTKEAAVQAFRRAYDKPGFLGPVDKLSVGALQAWLLKEKNRGRKIVVREAAKAVSGPSESAALLPPGIGGDPSHGGALRAERRTDKAGRTQTRWIAAHADPAFALPEGWHDADPKTRQRFPAGAQLHPDLRAQLVALGVSKLPAAHLPVADMDVAHPDAHPHRAALLRWRDNKGRLQSGYSAEFIRKQAIKKWTRIETLRPQIGRMIVEMRADLRRAAPGTITHAATAAALLIGISGLRPGSTTSAQDGHYGITTLTPGHIAVAGDVIRLAFIGKGGKENKAVVEDAELAAAVRHYVEQPASPERLWPVSLGALRTATPQGVRPKDFRTVFATNEAERLLTAATPPRVVGDDAKDKSTTRRALRAVFRAVADRLNNTPAVARRAYVAPGVVRDALRRWGVSEEMIDAELA